MSNQSTAGFITKLSNILDNSYLSPIINWVDFDSFVIYDQELFQNEVLSNYFRHKRFSSFVRQLNMYGFHKHRGDKDILQFSHPLFKKSKPQLYHLIERKKVKIAVSLSDETIKGDYLENISQKHIPCQRKVPESIVQIKSKFNLNASEMTIRLNVNLTSLATIQLEDEQEQLSICCDSTDNLKFQKQDQNEQVETILNSLTDNSHLFFQTK